MKTPATTIDRVIGVVMAASLLIIAVVTATGSDSGTYMVFAKRNTVANLFEQEPAIDEGVPSNDRVFEVPISLDNQGQINSDQAVASGGGIFQNSDETTTLQSKLVPPADELPSDEQDDGVTEEGPTPEEEEPQEGPPDGDGTGN